MDTRFKSEFRKLARRYGVEKVFEIPESTGIGIIGPGNIRGTIYWFDWTRCYTFTLHHDSKPQASGVSFAWDMCEAYIEALNDLLAQAGDFYNGVVEAKRLADAKPARKARRAVVESEAVGQQDK